MKNLFYISQLESFFDQINDVLLVVSAEKELLTYNRRAEMLLGGAKGIQNIVSTYLKLNIKHSPLPHDLGIGNNKIFIRWQRIALPLDSNGAETYLLIGTDFSEIEELQQKLFKLEYIIKKVPGHVFWKDEKSTLLGCNNNFARQVGLRSPEEITGKMDDDLPWTQEQTKAFLLDDQEVMRSRKPKLNIEEPQRQANGKEAILLTSKVPTYNVKGEVTGVLGTYIDITQLKQTEKALRQAKERAELANEAKSQFIANMEHDLRTPCAGISAAARLLESQESDPEKREILHLISTASTRLLNTLNGILDFSHVESSILPIQDKQLNVKQILDDILCIEAPMARLKNLSIIVDYAPDIPTVLIGDEHRISRIILNLLGNAIKFTDKGRVALEIKRGKQISPRKIAVHIAISDTGIGIPKDKHESIFERFVRVSPSNKGLYEGSGLGLSIVKKFAEELGGKYKVESKLGRGSTFTCIIPMKIPPKKTASTQSSAKKHISKYTKDNLRILLVEDNAFVRQATYMMVNATYPNMIEMATTGQEAIEQASKKPYHLILMDIGLPDMTGSEAAYQIQHTKGPNKQTPIVALTAHSATIAKNDSQSSAICAYITKPLTLPTLEETIKKWNNIKH